LQLRRKAFAVLRTSRTVLATPRKLFRLRLKRKGKSLREAAFFNFTLPSG